MLGLAVVLTVAGAFYNNFGDNFLPAFYVGKLILSSLFWVFLDETKKNAHNKFLGFRIFCDILMFILGYVMMKGSSLDEMCYILYCTVILLNLSASTICVLVMGSEEEPTREVYIRDEA